MKKIETPKLDDLIDYVLNKNKEGEISDSLIAEFATKLREANDELRAMALKLISKSVNRIGWIGFVVGIAITTTIYIILFFIFN